MHRWFDCSLIVLLLASLMSAQQKTPPDSKKAAPPEPTFSARLPTEETVNAFMQQMFGHDSSVSWKVLEIKPAEAEGLAEVTVTVSNAQGKQNQKLYVTADGHQDRKSTRLNSSHLGISYAVFCLKKKKIKKDEVMKCS